MRAIVGLLVSLVLAGCASSLVPDRPQGRYSLPSWPRESISLEVLDSRDRKDDSARLVDITAAILSDALAAATAPPVTPRQLIVEIMLHDVALHGPRWIATTRLRATLFEGGRALRTWEARGEQRWMNWVPANAQMASQDAYERALGGLVYRLEHSPP